MPRYLIKPVAADDFYVVWSTVVDAPIDWGSRAELEADDPELTADRFDRADTSGSSSLDGFCTFYEDDRSVIVMQQGWLEVGKLRQLTDLLDRSGGVLTATAKALLHPIDGRG